jgi:hypothetical protein
MTELTKLSERWSKLMVWRAKQAKQRFKRASGERPRVAGQCSRIAMHAAEGVTRHARTQAKVSNVVKDQVHNASPPKKCPLRFLAPSESLLAFSKGLRGF